MVSSNTGEHRNGQRALLFPLFLQFVPKAWRTRNSSAMEAKGLALVWSGQSDTYLYDEKNQGVILVWEQQA